LAYNIKGLILPKNTKPGISKCFESALERNFRKPNGCVSFLLSFSLVLAVEVQFANNMDSHNKFLKKLLARKLFVIL